MIKRTFLLAALLLIPVTTFGNEEPPAWAVEARQKSAELGARLIEALRAALASRGPMGGVEVCSARAPELARRISDDRFKVGRTALRVRNPDNAADAWERSILRRFDDELNHGADPAGLEAWKIESTVDGSVGRYMKAIPTGAQCVICHGESLTPDLEKTIERLYPADQATGFAPGDLRGAFTVTVALPAGD